MKLRFLSMLFFLLFILSFESCKKDNNGITESDNYIFIEQHATTYGEHISGPVPPLLMIDFPTYSYDPDTKILNGIIDFEISKDLKVIYGSGSCLSGAAGGGCGTGLSAVYSIPYERGSYELLKTETDGSIVAIYGEEVISLAAGEEWKTETTIMDSTQIDGQTSIVKLTKTDRITNFGVLKKSDIISWEW